VNKLNLNSQCKDMKKIQNNKIYLEFLTNNSFFCPSRSATFIEWSVHPNVTCHLLRCAFYLVFTTTACHNSILFLKNFISIHCRNNLLRLEYRSHHIQQHE